MEFQEKLLLRFTDPYQLRVNNQKQNEINKSYKEPKLRLGAMWKAKFMTLI